LIQSYKEYLVRYSKNKSNQYQGFIIGFERETFMRRDTKEELLSDLKKKWQKRNK